MQSDNKGRGLANNLTAQMALLAAAVIVMLFIGWHYIW
jgi:hypothetical protein